MALNIEKLTLADIEILEKMLPERKELLKQEQQKVFQDMNAFLKMHNIRKADIFFEEYLSYKSFVNKGVNKVKGVTKPKYINPFNLEQSWTGKGPRPLWLLKGIENNLFTLEDCIKKAQEINLENVNNKDSLNLSSNEI